MLYLSRLSLTKTLGSSTVCSDPLIGYGEELFLELIEVAWKVDLDLLFGFSFHLRFIFGSELVNGFIIVHDALYFHFEGKVVDLGLHLVHFAFFGNFLGDFSPHKVI